MHLLYGAGAGPRGAASEHRSGSSKGIRSRVLQQKIMRRIPEGNDSGRN